MKKFFPSVEIVARKRISKGRLEKLMVEAKIGSYTLLVREIWIKNTLTRYGYQLLRNRSHVLRYDNAPHHPEVPTFPHNKHVGDDVEPLENPSLEKFLEEAKQIVDLHSSA